MKRLFLIVLALWVAVGIARAETPLGLSGAFIQGGLVQGQTVPGAQVRLDDEATAVAADGRFLLGFSRTAAPAATLEVRLPDGTVMSRSLSIAQRTYGEQRINGLPSRKVTPNDDDLRRIRDEQKIISAARAVYSATPLFDSGFVWPTSGVITGVYGTARFLNGEPRQPHYGIDIAAPAGTPVVAPAAGIVTMVHPDMFFTGKTIIVDHGRGLNSTFLHLSSIAVAEGQAVTQGELIGAVGSTGRSTGPHLDWRVNLLSARLDPELLAGPMPEAEAKAD
ncbi:MAG: M23 family metallopeptidase [Alphaproteobacteria bacterium]|nr:M23 family metallopeptidase [Alphaproteobacteria bacterium]